MVHSYEEHVDHEKYKIYGSKIKGIPGSGMELNPVFKEIHKLKVLYGIK